MWVLADGFASSHLRQELHLNWRPRGVELHLFQPFLQNRYFYFGRRMHHKVMVTDQTKAVVGGINIADRYNDRGDEKGWLDFAVLIEGPIVPAIREWCRKMALEAGCRSIDAVQPSYKTKPIGNSQVRIRRNDWIWHHNEISNTYIHLLRKARVDILIVCSYFIPGRALRRVMSRATANGVRVRVVLTGHSDIAIAKYAERWLYDWMWRNRMEIYEYQGRILHGKVTLCDSEWLTVGSYNINNISTYASIELNVDIQDPELTQSVRKRFETLMLEECIRIDEHWRARHYSIPERLFRWAAFQTIALIFRLFTFYFKRQSRKEKTRAA